MDGWIEMENAEDYTLANVAEQAIYALSDTHSHIVAHTTISET